MKKIISILILISFMFILCSDAIAITVYKVNLNVSFVSNLLFSKYDVDLYLNDLKLDKLSHGQDYSDSFFVEGGTHQIYFYRVGDKRIMGSINFVVTGNTTINCSISCTKDEINVNQEIQVDEGKYTYSSEESKEPIQEVEESEIDEDPKNEMENIKTAYAEETPNEAVPLISIETAKKAVLAGICNDRSLDIYTDDGDFYDRSKFHGYERFFNKWIVVDEGVWTLTDNNNTWHVSDFLIHDKDLTEHWYYKYSFDVRFDGKYYLLENGYMIGAYNMKYFDKSNSARFDERDLSNLEFYTIFIIEPWQIGE